MQAHGAEPSGPPRETYLVGTGQTRSPEEFRTEIVWPLATEPCQDCPSDRTANQFSALNKASGLECPHRVRAQEPLRSWHYRRRALSFRGLC